MNKELIRVTHINNSDLTGRRFNGYDLINDLVPYGIQSRQIVLKKESDNPLVAPLVSTKFEDKLLHHLTEIEWENSYNKLIYPYAQQISQMPEFLEADIIHYHLIHNNVLSLFDFSWLSSLKPCIWTIHDPWIATGHCLHPENCNGWVRGCKPCPHLDWSFPLKTDTANKMWDIKYALAGSCKAQPVVASEWMNGILARSPIARQLKTPKIIPFGIDTSQPLPSHLRSKSRAAMEIPEDDFVLFFRCDGSPHKGVDDIITALDLWDAPPNSTLLTVGNRMLPSEITKRFNSVQLGWLSSADELYRAFNACDIFLMPSTAEAFGLMAIEAMAAERPVICFEGTALPDIVHAPEVGIAVPMRNTHELCKSIDFLARNSEERARRGLRGRELVEQVYSHATYLSSLNELYRNTLRDSC